MFVLTDRQYYFLERKVSIISDESLGLIFQIVFDINLFFYQYSYFNQNPHLLPETPLPIASLVHRGAHHDQQLWQQGLRVGLPGCHHR